jgi:hypothetical protein
MLEQHVDSIIKQYDLEMFNYHAQLQQEEEEFSAVSWLKGLSQEMFMGRG